MINKVVRDRLLASTIIAGALITAAPAFAQNTPTQVASAATPTVPDEIVVTGSLFKRATASETPSPVTVLNQDTLSRAGITNIADAIRSISADGAGSISTGFQNGFSAGGSAVSLRGLGVSSTLILVDGLRTVNFPLNDDGHNAYTDLNSIPFSTVERVEVLKDGASSTYGADAIGGVVNLIMRKHYVGVDGKVEGGIAQKGYGQRLRANLAGGIGDYEANGWNFWAGAEYQHDGAVSVRDVGFPFNTTDLSSIGLADQNTADSSLSTNTVNAVVRLAGQTNLNDPFTGGIVATGAYTTLNLANCANGTYTVAGAAGGTGCKHDNTLEFSQVQPRQERYSFNGRLSIRLSDTIEGYITGSYTHNEVNIRGASPAIRQRQPYGAAPTTASNNPGVVLPVYVCSAGVNCATASDRRLNPNNPYAAQFAANPAAGAARIYYIFGDIVGGSNRSNEVIRGTAGLFGTISDKFNWRVDVVGAKDNFNNQQLSTISIDGLRQAINTGAYNFINPEQNSEAVRRLVAPIYTTPSHSSQASIDASVTTALFTLPGGDVQLAVGGQVRRETLENNSINPVLANYGNTAAAFGKHTVSAAYFEVEAPLLPDDKLIVNASGRYDHYSEGFSHFSPKIGAKFTPIREIALRGTFSKGFRAPTFAESNPRSSYPGFVTFQPPANFVAAHGGTSNTFYTQSYSVGGGFSGNPNLKPEKSRSFTAGAIFSPTRWLNVTVDYYNVKKTDVIVAGPDAGRARSAYYSVAGNSYPSAAAASAAGCAAVAAVAGYSCSAIDAVDPLFPNALPRVLVINGPYVNAGYFKTQGLDFGATATIPLGDNLKLISRVDVQDILKFNVDFGDGFVRKYVGTLGPYELSSGAGTPKWRGNWQNTLQFGRFTISATTYYVSKIKQVAADEEAGGAAITCAAVAGDLYPYPTTDSLNKYCNIKKFIYADLNATVEVNDKFSVYVNVGNFTNERAPIAPTSYSGTNYLPTWHIAGVIGRTFRAGAAFKF